MSPLQVCQLSRSSGSTHFLSLRSDVASKLLIFRTAFFVDASLEILGARVGLGMRALEGGRGQDP